MNKNYKCGTRLVHDTAWYASGGRLRKVVTISTKRITRPEMYNMTDIYAVKPDTTQTPTVSPRIIIRSIVRRLRQGAQIIVTALIRHNTWS